MAEEQKATTAAEPAPTTASTMIDTSETSKDPSQMTEEEKKTRLDEIKRQMKAQSSATIVKETWGGDRSSASVTATIVAPTEAQPKKKRAAFGDSAVASVSTSASTKPRPNFEDSVVVSSSTATATSTVESTQKPKEAVSQEEKKVVAEPRQGLVFSTDDDAADPRQGYIFSTDDPLPEEEEKKSTTTMIKTDQEAEGEEKPKPAIAYKVELTSTRVGSNKFSKLPIADQHLIIAKKMEKDFAKQISTAKVNEATGAPQQKKRGGALFGQRNAASYNFEAEKAHKYFNKIDTDYLMGEIKGLESADRPAFMKFMARGRSMLQCAIEGDLDGFQKLFTEEPKLQNLMFWHIQRAFKEAVKYRRLFIVEYIVEELGIKLNHDCFQGYFHRVIQSFVDADEDQDEVDQDVNRMICRYLCAASDKESIDHMDQTDGSTVLHIACEELRDLQIVELLVTAGADLDPVRNDDKLPLTIIRERLEADPDNNDLFDIEEFLTRKGAKVSWRK